MICKLCDKFYLDEDSITGIFTFSKVCEACKKKFIPNELYEVIPINHGLIEYHYLYENMNLNIKQKYYLNQYLDILYLKIIDQFNKYDLYIFLDDDVYYETSYFGDLVNDYKHVFIFSLMRKELMYKTIF
ncbi:MAG: hypothetical protein PF513_04760 [Tenericutes bacterium]|jgi:hypothetical protein|nr:hypothetical protein [Mycoplasmatota bacterium]